MNRLPADATSVGVAAAAAPAELNSPLLVGFPKPPVAPKPPAPPPPPDDPKPPPNPPAEDEEGAGAAVEAKLNPDADPKPEDEAWVAAGVLAASAGEAKEKAAADWAADGAAEPKEDCWAEPKPEEAGAAL